MQTTDNSQSLRVQDKDTFQLKLKASSLNK